MIGPFVQGFLLMGVIYWYSKGMLTMINEYYRDEFRQYLDKDGKKNLVLKPKPGNTPGENALKSISDLSPKIEGLPDIFLNAEETTLSESNNPSVRTTNIDNCNRSPPMHSPRRTTSNRDGILERSLNPINSPNEEKFTTRHVVDSNLEMLISSLKDANKNLQSSVDIRLSECKEFRRENDDENDDGDDDDDDNDENCNDGRHNDNIYSRKNIDSDDKDRTYADISTSITKNKFPSETYLLHSEELLNSRKSNYKSHLSLSDSKLEEKSILNPSASTNKLNYRQITNQQVPINSIEKTTTERTKTMGMKNENQDIIASMCNTKTMNIPTKSSSDDGNKQQLGCSGSNVTVMKIPKLIETKVSIELEENTFVETEKESPSSISSKFRTNWIENDNKVNSSSSFSTKSNLNEFNNISKERRKSDSYGIVLNSICSSSGDDKNSNKIHHYGNDDNRRNSREKFFHSEIHSPIETNMKLKYSNGNEMIRKNSNENNNDLIDNNLDRIDRLSVDTIPTKLTIASVNNGICRRKSVTEMVQFWSNYQENN